LENVINENENLLNLDS